MNDLTPSEKLDRVLSYFKEHKDNDLTTNDINKYLNITFPGDFQTSDIKGILRRLHRDRHIHSRLGIHKITLEGIVFLENGGYQVNRQEVKIKKQYLSWAARLSEERASLFPWLMGILILLIAIIVIATVYFNWHWGITS